jgi:hypothetical protein
MRCIIANMLPNKSRTASDGYVTLSNWLTDVAPVTTSASTQGIRDHVRSKERSRPR